MAAASMLKENPAGITKPTTSFEQPNCSSFSIQRGIIASDAVATNTNRISSLKYPSTRDSLKPQSLSTNPKTTTMKARQIAKTANTNYPRCPVRGLHQRRHPDRGRQD